MLGRPDPAEAYRLISRDARIEGADSAALVHICYDEAIAALDRAIYASEQARWDIRSRSLSRAASAIAALRKGIDTALPISGALLDIYDAASSAILGAVGGREVAVLHHVRNDLTDIATALGAERRAF